MVSATTRADAAAVPASTPTPETRIAAIAERHVYLYGEYPTKDSRQAEIRAAAVDACRTMIRECGEAVLDAIESAEVLVGGYRQKISGYDVWLLLNAEPKHAAKAVHEMLLAARPSAAKEGTAGYYPYVPPRREESAGAKALKLALSNYTFSSVNGGDSSDGPSDMSHCYDRS